MVEHKTNFLGVGFDDDNPYFYVLNTENREIAKHEKWFEKNFEWSIFGENIIIIWILVKSRSVAPAKLEINLVSPKSIKSPYT